MIHMNYIISLTAASIVSYLIGSLNSAIVAGYLIKHKDIQGFTAAIMPD